MTSPAQNPRVAGSPTRTFLPDRSLWAVTIVLLLQLYAVTRDYNYTPATKARPWAPAQHKLTSELLGVG